MNCKSLFVKGSAAFLGLAMFFGAAGLQPVQADPKVGQTVNIVKTWNAKDKQPASVGMKFFKIDEGGNAFAKLLAFDKSGRVIWRGPEITDTSDPKLVGSLLWGESEIQTIADIDGDGKLELMVAVPRSDLRPAVYSIWRWNGKAFEYLRKKCLISAQNENVLPWKDLPQNYGDNVHWVDKFHPVGADGKIKATVVYFNGKDIRSAEAVMHPVKDGMVIEKFIGSGETKADS